MPREGVYQFFLSKDQSLDYYLSKIETTFKTQVLLKSGVEICHHWHQEHTSLLFTPDNQPFVSEKYIVTLLVDRVSLI